MYIPVSAVYLDSVYIYTQSHSLDSSKIFLVAQVHVGTSSCVLQDINISHSSDSITTQLCYTGGSSLTICYRTDTMELGVKKNGLVYITAIIKEATNQQCTTFTFKKDTLHFTSNTLPNSISSVSHFENNVLLFPNPVSTHLSILKPQNSEFNYRILSVDGCVLMNGSFNQQSNSPINVSSLPAGMYLLQAQDDKQRWIKRFVKE